ncbi:MAG: glycosyltransferase family 2 protein [Lachnospiraceae bacterium]|nr:glycosyltransferase family 2 protein [Lachnospiraceae bacterium]
MSKISVIVPFYNVEKTISSCLRNLAWQTHEDIEIILINNASTDHSADIAKDCANTFPDKMRVIDLEENKGVGAAKNAGLKEASGDYIVFVDNDGVLETTMVEKMFDVATKENCDMVEGTAYIPGINMLMLQTPLDCVGKLDADKKATLIARGGLFTTRLFKKELFEGITFRENVIHEDSENLIKVILKADSVGVTNDIVFKYNSGAAYSKASNDPLNIHKSLSDAMTVINEEFLKSGIIKDDKIKEAIIFQLMQHYIDAMFNVHNSNGRFTSKTIKFYQDELKQLKKKLSLPAVEDNEFAKQKFSAKDKELYLK